MKAAPFSRRPPAPDPELSALKAELAHAQTDLSCAYQQFNQAVDPDLVESCIYQISAVKARYNFLLRAIKKRAPADSEGTPLWN